MDGNRLHSASFSGIVREAGVCPQPHCWKKLVGRREGQASVMGRVCSRSLELHNFGLGIDICFFGLCVHARVYSWLHVCGYMFLCVPVCGGQRLTSGILLPYCLHHILRQSLSLEPRLAIQLREPHLCPPHVSMLLSKKSSCLQSRMHYLIFPNFVCNHVLFQILFYQKCVPKSQFPMPLSAFFLSCPIPLRYPQYTEEPLRGILGIALGWMVIFLPATLVTSHFLLVLLQSVFWVPSTHCTLIPSEFCSW